MGMYIGNMYWKFSWLLLAAAFILTVAAQRQVTANFQRYRQVKTGKGITGSRAAEIILTARGLTGVRVGEIGGMLTDHYDPRDNSLSLSQAVFEDDSISSVAVAAHECGHAIQEAEGYSMLRIRDRIGIPVSIVSKAAIPLLIIGVAVTQAGMYTQGNLVFNLGLICFIGVVIFHLVTLPVELDASRRAINELLANNIIYEDEVEGARKVLRAAAMTYVAALATAVANLIRILLIRRND